MKYIATIILTTAFLTAGAPALSQNSAKDLGPCMIDALNGKERKQLAKWIFFAIAAHPDINSYLNATADDISESDEQIGKLITRLLTSDCPDQLRAVGQKDPLALQKSFELVGQVAMQELMTNKNVMQAITNYAQYADQEKINSVLTGQ